MTTTHTLRAITALAITTLTAFATQPARADATLDKIKQRGKVAIGVLVNGGPFGSIDPATQQLVGWNPELARDLAKRLGVEAELVQVNPSNRVQFLQQGRVDLLIASMEYNADRGELLSYAPTPFYRGGGTAAVLKTSGIHQWEDLRGKVACVSQGSNFAKPLAEKYGAIVKGLRGIPESLLALKGGTCAASVHIQPALYQTLSGPSKAEWTAFTLATDDQLIPSPTVVWTRRGEQDTVAFVDKAIRDWHRSGFLLNVARKSGVPDGAYIRPAHDHAKQGKFDVAPQDFAVYTEGRS